jgi:hypothetical protein
MTKAKNGDESVKPKYDTSTKCETRTIQKGFKTGPRELLSSSKKRGQKKGEILSNLQLSFKSFRKSILFLCCPINALYTIYAKIIFLIHYFFFFEEM